MSDVLGVVVTMQGSVERRLDSRQVSLSDREWWTSLDEGYWEAILEQGEKAPEVVPPADPQETFQTLNVDRQPSQSRRQAPVDEDLVSDGEHGWEVAQLALDQGELFCLRVSGANRGGLLVDWNGLQGFVPASHLQEMPVCQQPRERVAELARYIDTSLTVRLIEVDRQQNRLVFSERAGKTDMTPAALLASLHPGDRCQGVVTNLTAFGAFVDLGGVEGLIHISELSWDRVRHPGDVLMLGQEVKVHVLGVNPDEGRIALSLKRLRPNPWIGVEERYQAGQVLKGTVTSVVSFGAFVRIEEGVEGLIHISELAEGSLLHPRNIVREGDVVRVLVLKVDQANQRLGLSLRQARGRGRAASG
jgi:small subunit ribosomal protein S1